MQQLTILNETKLKALKSNDVISSFIKAFKEMDLHTLESLIDDDLILKKEIIINEESKIDAETKWTFLSDVKRIFDIYHSGGVHALEMHTGKCMNCFKGGNVYYFKADFEKRGWGGPIYLGMNECKLTIRKCCSPEMH